MRSDQISSLNAQTTPRDSSSHILKKTNKKTKFLPSICLLTISLTTINASWVPKRISAKAANKTNQFRKLYASSIFLAYC